MKHATYDFISREKLTSTQRRKSRTKSFINLHDSSCNSLESFDFNLLLILSNPPAAFGANKISVT